ncbi:NtaA/DmoA family FMN-dependent monooxygenase [Microbacterium sp. 18062]|uniref:NtaA/DmoA family FMN-dependent monooxygenase n=1 Tax=Microbacterium sp. 18062 TaxID=2681410 RepID=UPI00135A4DDC|nr:NtaA/DmoA family FMN-dependent monooxygenase [Microbacterium sp. 18062]
MTNRIILGSLHQTTVGHTSQGFWRHPAAQAHRYAELGYWSDVAGKLDRAGVDFLFFADVVGALEDYRGTPDAALERAVELPMIDPLLIISALAQSTERLGFAVTGSTTYENPFLLARKFATLDLVTRGRIGFNVVTSALASAARGYGLERPFPHDERYDMADEFLEIAYDYWEGSWADDAVVRDREAGVYTDPTKVRRIRNEGRYFRTDSIALTEPTPQRTPVVFQAGASTRGRAFAAAHAEAIFLVHDDPVATARAVADIRRIAAENSRDPRDVKILSMATVVTAPTDAAAAALADEFRSYFDHEAELAQLSALFGIDLSQVDPDLPLEHAETDAIRGMLEIYTKRDADKRWTTREIAELNNLAGAGPLFVGSPTTVVDGLEAWIEATGVDGFNLADPVPPLTLDMLVDDVVPELRRRGLVDPVDRSAAPLTLRERLQGPGNARTRPGNHPSAARRYS